MKNLFLGMMLIVVTLSTQAQEKKNKNAKYTIDVNGKPRASLVTISGIPSTGNFVVGRQSYIIKQHPAQLNTFPGYRVFGIEYRQREMFRNGQRICL